MKALILAAGLGTRLRPATDVLPKALLKVGGYTLLEFAIKKVAHHGFKDIIVNVHHFSSQIIEYLKQNNNFGLKITISDESERLLDTGGALKKAVWFFDTKEPFLIYNADIVSNINLSRLYQDHSEHNALATLAVRRRESSRYLLFNEYMQLTEWLNNEKGLRKIVRLTNKPPQPFAFSGIHVINPRISDYFPKEEIFSIIDLYTEIGKTQSIRGYLDESTVFIDAGKPLQLSEASAIASEELF